MSETEPTIYPAQELLVAIGPLGNRVILGARGMLARDIAGSAGFGVASLPLAMAIALDPLGVGLWVYSGAGEVRPAVLADFARFGLRTPAPRNPPEGATSP